MITQFSKIKGVGINAFPYKNLRINIIIPYLIMFLLFMLSIETGKTQTVFNENFNNGLSSSWRWLDQDNSAWNMNNGRLNMKRYVGCGFFCNQRVPVLYYPNVPVKDGTTATVKVGFDVNREYGQAGLIIWYNNDTYVKFIIEYWYANGLRMIFLQEIDAVKQNGNVISGSDNQVYDRIEVEIKVAVENGRLRSWYRRIGDANWTDECISQPLPNRGNINVGVFSQADAGSNDWAWFDDFSLTYPNDALTPPKITQQPSDITVNEGNNATFTVQATGNPSPTYQWKKGNTNVGTNSNSYTVTNAQFSDNGSTYSVVVSNSQGSVTSRTATLTVKQVVQEPWSGTPINLPAKIEIENFDKCAQNCAYYDGTTGNTGGQYRTSEDVDIEACSEGGYNVGWIDNGEWLEYTVSSTAANYEINLRYASAGSGGTVKAILNGVTLGTFNCPATGGWQTWQTVTLKNISVAAVTGKILRLELSGGLNLNWIEFKSGDITPPTTPGNFRVTGTTTSSISLAWDASGDNIGVTGYDLYNGSTLITPAIGNVTAYTATGLQSNTSYTFNIKAKDAAGNLSGNASVTGKTNQIIPDTIAPTAPTNLKATSTCNSVSLTWTASTDAIGVTGYIVYNGTTPTTIGNVTTYNVTGLSENTAYTFTVKAKDAAGNISNASNNANVTTTACPKGHKAYPSGTPVSLPGKVQAENYDVAITENGYYDVTTGNTGNQYRSDNVDIEVCTDAGGGYNVGWIDNTEWLEYTVAPVAGKYDINLRYASAAAGGSVKVLMGSTVLGTITFGGTGGWQSWQNGSLKNINISGGSDQVLRLELSGGFNINYIEFISLFVDTIAPSAPANIRTTAKTETSISLAWNASTDNVGVTAYDLYNGSTLVTPAIGNVTSYTVSGLVAQTAYIFIVKAKDAAGNISIASNVLKDTTLKPFVDTIAPSIPANLNVSTKTCNSVSLTWTSSTDNVAVSGYVVYNSTSPITIGNVTSYTISGLTENTAYSFSVKAKDASGNISKGSDIINVTTSVCPKDHSPYSGTPIVLPGKVQAENYDIALTAKAFYDATTGNTGGQYRNDDVDIEACSDAGGGFDVGWIDPAEWLEYTVAPDSGSYMVSVRFASGLATTGTVKVSLDGVVLGTVNMSNTGGWQSWNQIAFGPVQINKSISSILRLDFTSFGYNVNYIEFTKTTDSTNPPVAGQVTREYWSNVSGTLVSNIPVTTTPSGVEVLTSLEAPINWADNYGARIRGYIIPTTSGAYNFYISGDDNCELWLSTSNDPAGKAKVAEVVGWTNSREWAKYTSQKSATKNLVAGTKYYFEILHKEGGGGDNVAVAWTGPGVSAITVIGAANIEAYIPVKSLEEINQVNDINVQSLSIYPVPFTDEITISSDQAIDRIQIIDMLGLNKSIVSNVNSCQYILNTQTISSGSYIISIMLEDGSVIVKTIIK